MTTLPNEIVSLLSLFAPVFKQKRVFYKATLLFVGVLLCTAGVTVCAALRAIGLKSVPNYSRFHKLLNRDHWNMLQGSKILLNLIIRTFGSANLTFAFDDTIERRRGKKSLISDFL